MTNAATNTSPPSPQFTKFVRLLKELFMFDQADLDFGIYRIMNAKRDEITRFLEKDLLPQVRQTLGELESGDRKQVEDELAKAIESARQLGVDPDSVQKVQELRAKLDAAGGGLDATEAEVYSDLYNFFRRYYHEGDFISQRRYKEGVYAIPYEGEEVKLYWANHDQYYIKSSENFRNYSFRVKLQLPGDDEPQERRVTFKLVDADTERDNNRAAAGKERRFLLADEDPLVEQEDELFVRFEYRPPGDKAKQDSLNAAAVERILNYKPEPAEDADSEAAGLADSNPFAVWQTALMAKAPTESNPDRTLLARHLAEYTARNTFDYFIHKDLGGFLRRELDFYIKNEIVHLDDIEHETAPRVEQYLAKVKAIRRIAHKIIDLLAQIEDFQKRLWLKKKFVIQTQYCISLDLIPEEQLPVIADSDAQRDEWVRCYEIDKIESDLTQPGYSVPLKPSFLTHHAHLPVDTRHFERGFAGDLIGRLDRIHQLNGALINSENFQALSHLQDCYRERIKFVYIDPPYNTGDDDFLYKDNYRHSSWISLLRDRLLLCHQLLSEEGSIALSIDHEELGTLRTLLDKVFGRDNLISLVTIKRGSVTGHKAINPGVVNISEYVLFYAKNRASWIGNGVFSERDRDPRYAMFVENVEEAESEWTFCPLLDAVAKFHGVQRGKLKAKFGEKLESAIVEFVGKHSESVVRLADVSFSGVGKEFQDAIVESRNSPSKVLCHRRNGFPDVYLYSGQRLLFYKNKMKTIGERKVTVEKASDIWLDVLPNDLHNEGGVSLKKGKKPEALIARLIEMATDEDDIVLDFFCGSGTTSAVAQKMRRKWIAVDSASYFWDKAVLRMKNVVFGEQRGVSKAFGWGGGGAISVLEMESYEDTLNNLEVHRTSEQQALLESQPGFREDYILRYMLNVETAGSPSLLNVQRFTDPFAYQMEIGTGSAGETKLVNVDLIETFNWLLGLRVRHIDTIRGVRIVEGENPDGEKVLVLWRRLAELDNDALDDWFEMQGYNTRDQEYDLVYVNCDNNLENLRRPDQTWKVRLIEEDFHRLMFDVDDV